MRILIPIFALFFLQSCFIIKVYPTTTEKQEAPKSKAMLSSGKKAVLKGQSHEVLFYGSSAAPEEEFIFVADSLPSKKSKLVIRADGRGLTSGKSTSEMQEPLIVIDGVIQKEKIDLKGIDPSQIETINVLKDNAALKKYGSQGRYGVVEIVTKK